jgi:hypothetical protein
VLNTVPFPPPRPERLTSIELVLGRLGLGDIDGPHRIFEQMVWCFRIRSGAKHRWQEPHGTRPSEFGSAISICSVSAAMVSSNFGFLPGHSSMWASILQCRTGCKHEMHVVNLRFAHSLR